MRHQKVSLCIAMATYNGALFIDKQISSILNQSYKDFQLVICDDHSTDNTVNIIQAYMHKYNNIILYENKERLGAVKNFEKVISLCESNYIALSDQDDIWNNKKLEILMNTMQKWEQSYKNKPLMVHSDLSMINEEGEEIFPSYFSFRNYILPKNRHLGYLLGPCGVMGNTIVMNKQLKLLVLPFPDDLIVHDYWIALMNELYGKRITVAQPLVAYRIHQNNLSNHIACLKKDSCTITSRNKIHLPYRDIGREKVLRMLLSSHTISLDDQKIITKFLNYLELKGNRVWIFYTLVSESFIKKGFYYRLKLFYKLLRKRGEII